MNDQPHPNAELPRTEAFVSAFESAGTIVAGKYKLLEQVGEGGMGSVWMAEQREPVKRLVAIKLIKSGMDTRSVLARFEAERQALAVMDHPNVARILDGGTTEQGRPFFVMELVKGLPLTEYCDSRRLSVPERLKLFADICQAVQHAHQKGIIHRDLKPGNILVTEHDGKPVPKVIDFGLAKALHGAAALTDMTLHTAFGTMVGTPLYMAPEQVGINALDVDTRTDIYSLGVILYELLTGTTPLERRQLKQAAWDEMKRLIRESDAPRPSQRLSSSDALPSVAANRGTEPKRLTGQVRGELDWIVLKSLEKDRNRRYETANGFAMDVQRHLAGEPVLAVPPSTGYRLKKFLRRYRWPVLAAGALAVTLLAGIAGTTIGLLEAKKQEELAKAETKAKDEALKSENAAKNQAEARRIEAETNLDYAMKGNEILGSVFAHLNPEVNYETVAELRIALKTYLLDAAKKLDESGINDPLALAEMQNTLGVSFLGLGEAEIAISLFRRSMEVRKANLGPDHPITLTTMNNLAQGYRDVGKLDLALPTCEEILRLRKVKLGPDHPDTFHTMLFMAVVYGAAGKHDLALPLYEETLKLHKAKHGPDHPATFNIMSYLAGGYQAAGKLDLALPIFEEILKLRKANLGNDHIDIAHGMNNLAGVYRAVGKLDLALPLYEDSLKLMKAKLGPTHHYTLTTMNNLAAGYLTAGKNDLAQPLYEETLKLRKTKLGDDHLDTLWATLHLAECYETVGKMTDAVVLFENTMKSGMSKHGAEHVITSSSRSKLAWTTRKSDCPPPTPQTILLCEQNRDAIGKKLGLEHSLYLATLHDLAFVYEAAKRYDDALPLWEHMLKVHLKSKDAKLTDAIYTLQYLTAACEKAGKKEIAAKWQAEFDAIKKQ
ncbi:MAG: serine/threonine protein kinase [Planctomycetia bacterium]|nr:serine/threonine protein kinase [Planctomycetia bacterium]